MKSKSLRTILLVTAAIAASGCSIINKSKPKTPVLGERTPVLTSELGVEVDPATAALPMNLPAAVANTEWAQSGGNAQKSMGHLALGSALGQAWAVSIGSGSTTSAAGFGAGGFGRQGIHDRHQFDRPRLRRDDRRDGLADALRRRQGQ
jgi:hypothetical protein